MIKILKLKKKIEDVEEKQRLQDIKVESFCQYKTIKNFIIAITAIIFIHFAFSYTVLDFQEQVKMSLDQLGSIVISDGTVVKATDFDYRNFNGENISLFPDLIEANIFKNNLLLLLVSIQTLIFGGLAFSNYKITKDTDSIAGVGMIIGSLFLLIVTFVFIIVFLFNRDTISNGTLFSHLLPIGIAGMIAFFCFGVFHNPKTSSSYKKMVKTLKKEKLIKENKTLETNRNSLLELNNKLYQDKNTIFEGIEATKNGDLNEEEIKYVKTFIFEAHKNIKQSDIEEQKKIKERKRQIEQKYAKEMTILANEMFNTNKSFEDIEIKNI